MSSKRTALVATTVSLAAGLGLGVTGFASAAGSSPSPAPSTKPTDRPPGDLKRGPGGDERHLGGAGGLVTALTSTAITVTTPDGSKTYPLTSTTTYFEGFEGKDKKAASAVKVGDVVALKLVDPAAAKPVVEEVHVVPAHVAGWVTKVSGSTITVTDPSGFTRTIAVTSATTYTKDGAAAKAADVKVGTFLGALGAVDADGTTLDATEISLGGKRLGGGPGFGGPGGHGRGHGGFGGPGVTRPSPAPSAKAG
jgi:hypothetical protein